MVVDERMVELVTPADDDADLDQSKLRHALRQTMRYAGEHGDIGLSQTEAFSCKFAHWAADNFDWPDYSTERLLSIKKVLNAWDMTPVGVPRRLDKRLCDPWRITGGVRVA